MYTSKKNNNENGSPSNRTSINELLMEGIRWELNDKGNNEVMKTNSFTKKLGLVLSILSGKSKYYGGQV